MAFEDDWQNLITEEADRFNSLSPQQRNTLVRRFAQRVARKEVTGSDPRMKAFLEANLSRPSAAPSLSQIGVEAAKEAFKQTATGMLGEAAISATQGRPAVRPTSEPIDARLSGAYQAIKAGKPMAAGRNLVSYASEIPSDIAQAVTGPILPGLAGATGAIAAQIPDIGVSATGGGLLAKGLMRAGLASRPAVVAGSTLADAALTGGAVKAVGGTTGEALTAGGVAGLGSALGAGLSTRGMPAPVRPVQPPPPQGINLMTGVPGTVTTRGRLATPALPAPGQTVAAPMFSEQALTGRIQSADMVNAQFQQAVANRIAAEQRLAQAMRPEEQAPALDMLNMARASEQAARADAENVLSRITQAQQLQRPIRLGAPEQPAPIPEPLALPAPSGPPMIPARGMSEQALYGAPPGSMPLDIIPPERRLLPPSGPEIGPRAELPAQPGYVSQTPMRGAEEAMLGQPINVSAIRSEIDAAARQRFSLQQQLDALPKLPTKATKAQVAERAATESGLRQAILEAGNRQMQGLQRLSEMGTPPSIIQQAIQAPVAEIVKKKAVSNPLEGTPLGRLLTEEGGAVTPTGAVGALGAPVAAAAGAIFRAIKAGPAALRAAAISRPYGAVAEGLSLAQDKVSNAVGSVMNFSPALSAAIAKVQASPGAAMAGFNSFLASRFPAVKQVMDDAGRLFLNNYGAPEAYIRLRQEAERAGRDVQNRLADYGLRVADATGDDAARTSRLYDDLTAETYTPGSNPLDDALVMEGRALTLDVGVQMNRVGALSDAALERWGSRYLPRIYQKHLQKAREDGVTSRFARFFEDDPTLAGYYHRGVTETIDSNNAGRLAEKQAQGFTIISRDADGNIGPNQNGKFVIWRDYTPEERNSWGEIKNAVIGLEKYARAARREVQNGTFLEGVRTGSDANGAWALSGESLFGASKVNRPKDFVAENGQRYVYIGDANRKQGPIKTYGTLADHYVRDDIAMQVKTANEFAFFKQAARIGKKATGMNWWKKLVTIGNPSYFANNFFVNMPMLELAGGSTADIPTATRLIAEGTDPLIKTLRDRGLIQDEVLLRRLSEKAAPILEQAAGSPTATMTRFASIMSRASNAVKRYETKAYDVAGASDDVFRVALVYGLMRRQGIKNVDEAIDLANTAFYNRKNVNAPIVDIAETFIPFAGVTHWTLGALPSLVWRNPHKAAYLATVAAAAPAVAEYMQGKGEPEETMAARRQLLPEQMRPGFLPALGFPNAIFAGYDDKGQPTYIDTSTWNPVNAITAEVPVGTAGDFPRALSIGGVPNILMQLYANKNFYTGRPIVESVGSRRTALDTSLLSQIPGVGKLAPAEVRSFLAQNLVPGIIRYPFEAARSAAAQSVSPELAVNAGLTSGESVPISLGTRAARMVGIKARPLNVSEAYAREAGVEETTLSSVRKNQAATLRKYQRALQNNNRAEAEAEMQKYLEYENYKTTIQQQEDERLQRLAPALRMTP